MLCPSSALCMHVRCLDLQLLRAICACKCALPCRACLGRDRGGFQLRCRGVSVLVACGEGIRGSACEASQVSSCASLHGRACDSLDEWGHGISS